METNKNGVVDRVLCPKREREAGSVQPVFHHQSFGFSMGEYLCLGQRCIQNCDYSFSRRTDV